MSASATQGGRNNYCSMNSYLCNVCCFQGNKYSEFPNGAQRHILLVMNWDLSFLDSLSWTWLHCVIWFCHF